MNKIFYDIDTLIIVCFSITLINIHEILSLIALILSIYYTTRKIKKDFFNKKNEDKEIN
jgi:hypothetical protein